MCVTRDLQPLGLAIPWFDKRAEAEAEAFASAAPFAHVGSHTSAAKWMWLRRHRETEIAGAACWIALTDYAAALWSGTPFMSEMLAARTGCLDVFTRDWHPAALDAAGAPPLPRLLRAGDITGTVGGGRLRESGAASERTLVVAGGHDHPVAATAIQRLDQATRIDSIGTANVVYGETRDTERARHRSTLEVSVPAMGGPGIALIGVTEFSATLLAAMGGEDVVRKLLATPRFAGEPDPPGDDDAARLRRALEQMALRARGFLDAMDRAGVPRGSIYATGGWARSTALVELRASMFREPVTVIDEPELVGLGAALLALDAAAGQPVSYQPARPSSVIDPLARWSERYAAL